MNTNALTAVPTASQALLRMGWFTLHGTAVFVPPLLLIAVGIRIYSARIARARRREELRVASHLLGRKH